MAARGSAAARWAMPAAMVASLTLFAFLAADVSSPGLVPPRPVALDNEALAAAPARTPFRYTLRAALDPEQHSIAGAGTISLENTSSAPLDHVFVHLYLNAFESDRTVLHRGPRDFRGAGAALGGRIDVQRFAVPAWGGADLWPHGATTPGDPDDRTDIRVPLPRPLPPGERLVFEVAWTSQLPPVSLRTGFSGSFHMAGQWFPKLAKLEPDGAFAHFPFEHLSEFYADFADWDVRVTTPAAFLVGATGEMVEEHAEGGLVERRFVQRGVHDFAFAAWDGFREMRAEHRGVTLRALHPAGAEAAATLELEVARRGLDLLGATYGAYPFATLTLVHPPEAAREAAGGMEYPTLITTGGPWWGPLVGARFTENVTIHELAHQWFQGMLASNEREYPFLDEGLTTFAELQVMDELVAPGSSASLALGLPLATAPYHRAWSAGAARRGAIARPARSFESGADYGALVYGRTATLLRTLDRVHDGAVARALAVYARRHRFRHPTPDDLVAAVRQEAGEQAAHSLRVGLFERGWIDASLDGLEARPAEGGGFASEVRVSREGSLELPVVVEVIDEHGGRHRARWDGRGASATLHVHTPGRPRFAVLDPDRVLLLDDDLLDGAWAARPPPAVAWRTLGAASFFSRAVLAGLGP